MKIVTIYGGPRPQGNTAAVLGWIEETLREEGHTVERFDLNELDIKGCQGCYACAGTLDAPGCVVRDDAQRILGAMVGADAIAYASPLYMWGVSGQLKLILDRGMSLVKDYMGPNYTSLVGGKKATLLVTCMGPIENNAEWARDQFVQYADYAKLDLIDPWILAGCSEPDKLDDSVKAKAADLAAQLVG